MSYELLPLFLFAFWVGLFAAQDTSNKNAKPSTAQVVADNAGASFLAYRNALTTYMTANPTKTGTIATAALTLPSGLILPATINNNIIATPSGNGRIIYTWATLPANTLNSMVNTQSGDPSLGIVSGTQWISPAYGVQPAPAPAFVPNGSTLSVLQIGN